MELWRRRRQLGEEVSAKRRLYLDVRFWNDLCDAELGAAKDARPGQLLAALRSSTARGDLVCPVECHVVEELHRQEIHEKRQATLSLIDELSRRTVLLSPPDRLFLEVLRLVQGLVAGTPPTRPPVEEMWTRPMFAIGHDFPELEAPGLPPEVAETLRHQMEEELWAFGFVDLFTMTGPPPIDTNAKITTAGLLNAAKRDVSNQFESYDATYWSEVRGALDAYLPQLEDIWRYLRHRIGGGVTTVTSSVLRDSALKLRHLLYEGARVTGLRSTVPSLHTGVTLYSRMQWDRKRSYKGNDVFDFAHAEAALPYCHAFATDASLASLVQQSGLAADYSCEVMTHSDHVVAWLAKP
jgi:hypothetical protein